MRKRTGLLNGGTGALSSAAKRGLTTNSILPSMVRWTACGSNGPVNDAIYRHYLPKSLADRARSLESFFDCLTVR